MINTNHGEKRRKYRCSTHMSNKIYSQIWDNPELDETSAERKQRLESEAWRRLTINKSVEAGHVQPSLFERARAFLHTLFR